MEGHTVTENFEAFLQTQPVCANEVKIFLELSEAQNIITSSYMNRKDFPGAMELTDVVRRGAIGVFGYAYEFSEHGITLPTTETASTTFPKTVVAGRTSKSRQEFEKWIMSQTDQFVAPAYRPTSNNGLHFVKAACEFLGVETPPVLQLIVDALKDLLNMLVKRASESSARSSVLGSSNSVDSDVDPATAPPRRVVKGFKSS